MTDLIAEEIHAMERHVEEEHIASAHDRALAYILFAHLEKAKANLAVAEALFSALLEGDDEA